MEDFLKDWAEKNAKNKGLVQNKQLYLIVDNDDLVFAVFDWIDDKCKNKDEILKLPVECQYFYAVYAVTNMIYAEDFETVYTDDLKQFMQLAADGLRKIGELELSEIIKASISVYEKSKVLIEQRKWENLLSLELWKNEYKKFNETYKSKVLNANLAKYIRLNECIFGG